MNNINNKQMLDPAFRAELRQNPVKVLAKSKVTLSKGTQIKVLSNTKNTCYIAFPSAAMGYDDLTELQAAGSTVGSAGSIGTLSSASTTVGCIACIGTAGTG